MKMSGPNDEFRDSPTEYDVSAGVPDLKRHRTMELA